MMRKSLEDRSQAINKILGKEDYNAPSTKRTWPIVAGTIGITALAFVVISALIRHRKLNRFAQVPHHYQPRSDETVICSRPIDTTLFQFFYPLIKHTYFKTEQGTLGYQYCDIGNTDCSDVVGTALLPDKPVHKVAKDPRNHRCWLVSTDPLFKECMKGKMTEVLTRYEHPNRYFSVFDNSCATFVDMVADECYNEINMNIILPKGENPVRVGADFLNKNPDSNK